MRQKISSVKWRAYCSAGGGGGYVLTNVVLNAFYETLTIFRNQNGLDRNQEFFIYNTTEQMKK